MQVQTYSGPPFEIFAQDIDYFELGDIIHFVSYCKIIQIEPPMSCRREKITETSMHNMTIRNIHIWYRPLHPKRPAPWINRVAMYLSLKEQEWLVRFPVSMRMPANCKQENWNQEINMSKVIEWKLDVFYSYPSYQTF